MTSNKNPFQKILPPSRKHNEGETTSSDEKQPLLGGLFSPRKGTEPSQEHHLGPHDSVRFWDVMMPPVKANMVHGKLIPTFSGLAIGKLHQTKSRITVEVHSDKPAEKEEKGGEKSEDDGGASPAKAVKAKDGTGVMEGLLRGLSMKHVDNKVLHDEEYIVMRIFRPAHGPGLFGRDGDEKDGDDDDEDERSVSSLSLSGVDKVRHIISSVAATQQLKKRRWALPITYMTFLFLHCSSALSGIPGWQVD